jgi:hypothetical protein
MLSQLTEAENVQAINAILAIKLGKLKKDSQ